MTLNLRLIHNTEDTQCSLLGVHMSLWAAWYHQWISFQGTFFIFLWPPFSFIKFYCFQFSVLMR